MLNLDNPTIIGLAKKFGKESEGIKLDPGEYRVNATLNLQVSGTVSKYESYLRAPTVEIPWKTVMALMLQRAGVTRENTLALLSEVLPEVILSGQDDKGVLEERIKDIDMMTGKVKSVIDSLPKQLCTGQTKVKLEISEI